MCPPIYVAHSAIVSMALAAIETFSNECTGCCLGDRKKGRGVIVACFPYQKANRRKMSVFSPSSSLFNALLDRGRYSKMCEFHSHIHPPKPVLPLGEYICPSEDDLLGIGRGRTEIIIEAMRVSWNASFLRKRGRMVSAAMGRYRLLIGAFTYLGKYKGELVHDEPDLRILG